jgi:hypothetical protein
MCNFLQPGRIPEPSDHDIFSRGLRTNEHSAGEGQYQFNSQFCSHVRVLSQEVISWKPVQVASNYVMTNEQ